LVDMEVTEAVLSEGFGVNFVQAQEKIAPNGK
jgi:hypothetical protein